MIVKGKVVRLLDRGVIVDLEDGLEGFIPLSQLGIEGLRKPSDSFKPEDTLELKVTRVDTQAHRIILSAKAWLTDQDAATQATFQEQYKPNPSATEEPVPVVVEDSGEGASS